MNMTMSPTEARALKNSQTPTRKIASSVSVVEARVRTATSAHQARHLGLDAGKALHQRHIAERVGGAFDEVRIVALDRALQRIGLADDEPGQKREQHAHRDQYQPEHPVEIERERQQHEERHRGSE
jgi:hypothetical protein